MNMRKVKVTLQEEVIQTVGTHITLDTTLLLDIV
jgi:hypothetical protein